MKLLFILTIMISSLQGVASAAQFTGFGLGAMIGDPTAFSFKGHLGQGRYFDAALAYNTGPADDLYLHGDYIVERNDFIDLKNGHYLNLYYGIGGRLYYADTKKHKDELHLGPRVPVGLNYYLKDPSVEFFGEISAVMDVVPETDVDIDFSIGARYWF